MYNNKTLSPPLLYLELVLQCVALNRISLKINAFLYIAIVESVMSIKIVYIIKPTRFFKYIYIKMREIIYRLKLDNVL